MFVVIAIMISGVLIGYLLRNHRLLFASKLITVLIWLLLFLLGVEVGDNGRVMSSLHTLGVEALVITVFALAGSLIAAWALWKWINSRKKDLRV